MSVLLLDPHCFVLNSRIDQSPPKRDLKVSDPSVRDLTLSELQLAPSSVLLIRFLDDSLNGTPPKSLAQIPIVIWSIATDYPAPLALSVLAQAVEMPSPVSLPVSEPSVPPLHAGSSNAAIASGKQIPKWLKLGRSM